MRLLVFCGTRDALERFRQAPGWRTNGGEEHFSQLVEWFNKTGNAQLAVGPGAWQGWRVPHDTAILFDPSWPFERDHPYTRQAVMRRAVSRLRHDTGLDDAEGAL